MTEAEPHFETLGTHLFPSAADKEYHMGHMWIHWTDGDEYPQGRGYWPVVTEIPKELRTAKAVRNFLITEKIPGRYVDESVNVDLTEEMKKQSRERKWPINLAQKLWLERRCHIEPGYDGMDEGFYSCDEDREDCHNCCSWALKVMYDATKNPVFLSCTRPKRLQSVEASLWGS